MEEASRQAHGYEDSGYLSETMLASRLPRLGRQPEMQDAEKMARVQDSCTGLLT